MKKKFHAFVLAFILLVSSIPHASASNITTVEQTYVLSESEIQATVDSTMVNVYHQLEAQDALVLLDIYRQIVEQEIRSSVMVKDVGVTVKAIPDADSGERSYTLTNGGIVAYLSEFDDYKPTEVVVTCMDRNRAYDYILEANSCVIGDVARDALGYVPCIGGISSFLFSLETVANTSSLASVRNANGYAKIINTYSREFGTSASVLMGWDTHPITTTPGNSINHYVRYFPAYTG